MSIPFDYSESDNYSDGVNYSEGFDMKSIQEAYKNGLQMNMAEQRKKLIYDDVIHAITPENIKSAMGCEEAVHRFIFYPSKRTFYMELDDVTDHDQDVPILKSILAELGFINLKSRAWGVEFTIP